MKPDALRLWVACLFLASVLAALVGCGADNSTGVTLRPATATVAPGGRCQFTAQQTGSHGPYPTPTFSVVEPGGGSVASDGMYTAPSGVGTFTVEATGSQGSATATVTVRADAVTSVAVTPPTATLGTGEGTQFAATVVGAADVPQAVTWSIQEAPAGGSVSTLGFYHTPSGPGLFHLVATSLADPAKSASGEITVSSGGLTVSIDPPAVTLAPNQVQHFTATVAGTPDTAVTFRVVELGGGVVDADGYYRAPELRGTFHVEAASHADPTKTATATITVPAGDAIGTIQ